MNTRHYIQKLSKFVEGSTKNTNQLIGCCGLDCESCDARIATLTNDNTPHEKTAALWTKLNEVTILPEMINCTGCRRLGSRVPRSHSHPIACHFQNEHCELH